MFKGHWKDFEKQYFISKALYLQNSYSKQELQFPRMKFNSYNYNNLLIRNKNKEKYIKLNKR